MGQLCYSYLTAAHWLSETAAVLLQHVNLLLQASGVHAMPLQAESQRPDMLLLPCNQSQSLAEAEARALCCTWPGKQWAARYRNE